GVKNSLFENRVRFAGSAYYIEWNEIQQNVYLPGCQLQFTDNVGAAVSKGVDLQADFVILPGLTLETTLGYNESYFTQSAPGNTVVRGDAVVGFAESLPTWQGTIGLQYTREVLGHEAFIRADYQYRGGNDRLAPSTDPDSGQFNPYAFSIPPNTFVSLRAGMHFGDWEVDAFVDNLFDSAAVTSYGQVGGDLVNFPVDPVSHTSAG